MTEETKAKKATAKTDFKEEVRAIIECRTISEDVKVTQIAALLEA